MGTLKDPRSHDDLLNYQLKRLVNLGGAPAVRLCEGGFGVTRQEWRLTAALVEEGPLSVNELSARALVPAARVSRMLAQLVDKGLASRVSTAADRRRATVSATPRARELYAALFPQLAAINRRMLEVLDEDEALLLQQLLARLTAHARAIYEEGGGIAVKTGRHLGSGRRTPAWNAPARG